ncbi:hypothetical protein ES703_16745 [subsurface metagenome]
MAFSNGASFNQPIEVSSGGLLPGVPFQLVYFGTEGPRRTCQAVNRKGAHNVRYPGQVVQPDPSQHSQGGGNLSAVDEGQTFLGLEDQGLQSQMLQGFRRRDGLAGQNHLPLAHQAKGHMRQGRQITAGSHRALGRDDRQDITVKKRPQLLYDFQTYSTVPLGQGDNFQQHGQADHICIQRRTDTDGMGSDEITLQCLVLVISDPHAAQLAETGVDAVDRNGFPG